MLVHCSDGAGRTGTYVLIDLVLSRMLKGVKEMDIAATLEHLRDQRAGVVSSKVTSVLGFSAVYFGWWGVVGDHMVGVLGDHVQKSSVHSDYCCATVINLHGDRREIKCTKSLGIV